LATLVATSTRVVSRRTVAHHGASSEGGAEFPRESPELIVSGSPGRAVTFPVTNDPVPASAGQRSRAANSLIYDGGR
jgi:hypothetical protein